MGTRGRSTGISSYATGNFTVPGNSGVSRYLQTAYEVGFKHGFLHSCITRLEMGERLSPKQISAVEKMMARRPASRLEEDQKWHKVIWDAYRAGADEEDKKKLKELSDTLEWRSLTPEQAQDAESLYRKYIGLGDMPSVWEPKQEESVPVEEFQGTEAYQYIQKAKEVGFTFGVVGSAIKMLDGGKTPTPKMVASIEKLMTKMSPEGLARAVEWQQMIDEILQKNVAEYQRDMLLDFKENLSWGRFSGKQADEVRKLYSEYVKGKTDWTCPRCGKKMASRFKACSQCSYKRAPIWE